MTAATIPIFSGGLGINNRVPAHRLTYDIESGVGAFAWADNVIISPSGEIVSSRGVVKIADGEFHSFFPVPGTDYGLVAMDRNNDAAIYNIKVDRAGTGVVLIGVRSGLTRGNRIDYTVFDDVVFYGNGIESGMIFNGETPAPWKQSEWPRRGTSRGYPAPAAPQHLCSFGGRIIMARVDDDGKNILYFTEYGMLGIMDGLRNTEQFQDRIIMLIPVSDGLYICTEREVFFCGGFNPNKWQFARVLEYPVLEWAIDKTPVDPMLFGMETSAKSFIAGSVNGPVLFMPGGRVVNLGQKNFDTVECNSVRSGSVAVYDDSLVIQTWS